MKNLYTTCFTALMSMNVPAQVVFDLPGAIPPFGTTESEAWFDLDGIPALPTTGQGLTWDLTTLTLMPFTVQRTISDPAATPYAADFPNSTHAVTNQGALPDWTYYTLTDDTLYLDGGAWPPDIFTCSRPRLAAAFPFSYGQLVNDSAVCQFPDFPEFHTKEGLELVATGTIDYPGGTIENVVMLRRWFNDAPQDDYYWHTTSDVLLYVGRYYPEGDQMNLYPNVDPSAIAEISTVSLTVYPLPAADDVFVEVGEYTGAVRYTLHDVIGRTLKSGTLSATGGRLLLDVTDLAPGNYIIRLPEVGTSAYAHVSVVR